MRQSVLMVLGIGVSLLLAGTAQSQTICDEDLDPTDSLHESRWQAGVKQLIDNGKYRDGHEELVKIYRERLAAMATVDTGVRAIVDDAIRIYLDVVDNSAFQQRGPADWNVTMAAISDDVVIRLGDIRQSPNRRDDMVVLPCTRVKQAGTFERAVAYFAHAMSRVSPPDLETPALILEAELSEYEDWLNNGLEMWPWELAYNSRNLPATGVPAQRILLRPSGLIGLDFSGTEESLATYGLAVEPFGWVWYERGSKRKKWKALSLLASITNDRGIGYGLLGRYDRFAMGLAYHENDSAVLLYFNVELQDYVLGKEAQGIQAQDFLNCLDLKIRRANVCEK